MSQDRAAAARAPEAAREGDLDEDERLIRQRRMEERVTPPIGLEPPPQIVPPLNLVDRLVLDQALEDDGRGPPVNPLPDQESAVEPRSEQARQVRVDHAAVRVPVEGLEQAPPHVHEHGDPAAGQIEAPEQFLPR